MKHISIIEFETAGEFLDALDKNKRKHGGKTALGGIIPESVYLVIESDGESSCIMSLSGEGSEGFKLSENITHTDLFNVAMMRLGISKVHYLT